MPPGAAVPRAGGAVGASSVPSSAAGGLASAAPHAGLLSLFPAPGSAGATAGEVSDPPSSHPIWDLCHFPVWVAPQ